MFKELEMKKELVEWEEEERERKESMEIAEYKEKEKTAGDKVSQSVISRLTKLAELG